jgi:hypothetical protein
MALNRLQNDQIKSVVLAFGVSAIAAISAMFVPVGLIESVTGATGISEMIPATAAPLGDTARAIIAFLAGAFTLIAASAVMLRQNNVPSMNKVHADTDLKVGDSKGIMARAAAISLPKITLPKIGLPKMPWTKNEDDILDLADLPRLRSFDAHPDAPARKPLSASSDLSSSMVKPTLSNAEAKFWGDPVEEPVTEEEAFEPVIESKPQYETVVAQEAEVIIPVEAIYEMPAPLVVSEPMPAPEPASAGSGADEPSLAEMVAQLEAAVIQRKAQLAELEIVAAGLMASKMETVAVAEPQEPEVVAEKFVAEILPPELPRPPLEAVPSSPRVEADDDMDAALNAALETLHRMNAQAR